MGRRGDAGAERRELASACGAGTAAAGSVPDVATTSLGVGLRHAPLAPGQLGGAV